MIEKLGITRRVQPLSSLQSGTASRQLNEVKTIIGSCYQDSPTAYDVIHGYPRSGDHGQAPLPLLAYRSQLASVIPDFLAT
jgi:hypothetical protein